MSRPEVSADASRRPALTLAAPLRRALRARQARGPAATRARQERLLLALDAATGALTSGVPAPSALARALDHAATALTPLAEGGTGPAVDAPRTRAALRLGGDVVAALRSDARTPGAEVLAQVAVCWHVSTATGAGLADGLAQVVRSEQAVAGIREELRAAIASARASATILALLPLLGLALGMILGANPVGWLLGSPLGWAALAAGLLAEGCGVMWSRRIIGRVERMARW